MDKIPKRYILFSLVSNVILGVIVILINRLIFNNQLSTPGLVTMTGIILILIYIDMVQYKKIHLGENENNDK